MASSFTSHIPIAASPTSWLGALAGGCRGYTAGMVVCLSWLERKKKPGTEQLVKRGLQIVRHIYTRVQRYFTYRCDGHSFLSIWFIRSEKLWFYMHGYVSQRSSLRLTRRKGCAQAIQSSSYLRRGSALDRQNAANPKFHYSFILCEEP